MKLHRLLRKTLLALVFVVAGLVRGKEEKPNQNSASAGDLFAQPQVYRLKIDLSPAAEQALQRDARTYVKATVREGDKVYSDVGLRLKGNASFQTLDKKPSLALKFNEFVHGQDFHKRSKILLNNAHQDPSYLCEAIAGEIFRNAGVPAAKVTFALVQLNGREIGLYVMSEAANREFLSQYFSKSKGNLYEGVNTDVGDKLEKDSGDGSEDQYDLKSLAVAAKDPDAAQRLKRLESLLDLDRFISFIAVEVMIGHHEGYAMARNNYRIYHDPASGRMVFIPHGLDNLFATPDAPLSPEWKGLIAKAVLESPEGKRRYRERMTKLLASVFQPATLQTRIDALAAKVRPALAERNEAAAKTFDSALTQLRYRVAQRAGILEQALSGPPK
jgi:spore coat protein H